MSSKPKKVSKLRVNKETAKDLHAGDEKAR